MNCRERRNLLFLTYLASFGLLACNDTVAKTDQQDDLEVCPSAFDVTAAVAVTNYIATAADFDCFLPEAQNAKSAAERWYGVRRFYVKNLTGKIGSALDVACGRKPGPYPVGTFLQLIPFEAMVKRGGGFSPESAGWEFFALDLSDNTTGVEAFIATRGNTETVNFTDSNCFECHRKAAPQFDFVCESDHGCDPIPLNDQLLEAFVRGDGRCAPYLDD